MRHARATRWVLGGILVLALAMLAGPGCKKSGSNGDDGGDDNPAGPGPTGQSDVPSDWVGVWDFDYEAVGCDNPGLVYAYGGKMTICPDEWVDQDGGDLGLTDCDVTWKDNEVTVRCTTVTSEGNCTTTIINNYTATVSGGNIDWHGTFETKYEGDCFGLPDNCMEVTMTGTRLSDAPDPCASAFEIDTDGGGDGGGGGGGGGGGNAGAGITIQATGEHAPGTIHWTDENANVSRIGNVYYVTAGVNSDTLISMVQIPVQTGVSTVDYMNPLGSVQVNYLEGELLMTNPAGTVTLTEADEYHLVGTFRIEGDVGYVPPTYARTLNGTLDLTVDYAGKAPGGAPTPKQIFRELQRIAP